MLNMFACDRKVIELLCEDGGEDHRFIKKIDIGDKKVTNI